MSTQRAGRNRLRLASPDMPEQPNTRERPQAAWPPVPDLFDVITYFRARGDSFILIASIGFWIGEDRKKALTARGLKLWYESELDRRETTKATIR
jgi:hypothetical protein